MTIKETCTQEEFESIHACVEKTRSTSATVKVPLQALRHLLADHSELHAALPGQ